MSSSYHAYAVVGVRAKELLEFEQVKFEYQKRVDGALVFDQNGNPIMGSYWAECVKFQSKKYSLTYDRRNFDGTFGDLRELLSGLGVKWISYDYRDVYDDDMLGIVVDEVKENCDGANIEQVTQAFGEMKRLLNLLGCNTKPKLYAAFHHSY